MRVVLVALVSLLPCACARAGDDAAPSPTEDSAVALDGASGGDARDAALDVADARRPDTNGAEGDAIFPVDDGAVGLCATPAGTTVTASGAYMSTPDLVVDGKIETGWNSGGYDGWLRLKLPKAVRFDRIHVAANALPACTEPYTFKVLLAGVEQVNETRALAVPAGTDWLPPIEVTAGDYDEVAIEVGTSASWIAISEVVLYDSTAKCP